MTKLLQLTRDIITYQLAKTSMEKEAEVARVTRELRTALELLYTSFDVEPYPPSEEHTSQEYGLLFRHGKEFSSRNLTLLTHKKFESLDLFVVHPNPLDRESCYEFMTLSRKIVMQDWQEELYLSEIAEKMSVHGSPRTSKNCWEHKHQITIESELGLPVLSTRLSTHVHFNWSLNKEDIEKLCDPNNAYRLFEAYQRRRINTVYKEVSDALEAHSKVRTTLKKNNEKR